MQISAFLTFIMPARFTYFSLKGLHYDPSKPNDCALFMFGLLFI
jgi:hypothetical protein